MSIRHDVNRLIIGFVKGETLQTFDRFYSDHVIVNENGIGERRGKAENRKSLGKFCENVQVLHSFHAVSALVDGNKAIIEWRMDFTPKWGSRTIFKQVSVQILMEEKIIQETIYHQQPIRVPADMLHQQHDLLTST